MGKKAEEILQKEAEYKNMLLYTQEIEQRYSRAREIQHDYKNILTSLYSYIEDGDLDGLKQYYDDEIESTFNASEKNLFALESLSKVKVSAIKGILAAKVIRAENLGIDTVFEAIDDIHSIRIDSISLVRMLGIILDNAIEELTEISEGVLVVACYKSGGGVTFVVQNTCRQDISNLAELKKRGFSTKGDDRGLGLNILSELAGHYDNVILHTIISNGKFTQRLCVGEADE